jgi:pectate lyase
MFAGRRVLLCASTLLLAGAPAFATSALPTEKPLGWASQNGGTTGGAGGTEVTVTTMADLQKYAKASGKYIIWVKGTMGSFGARGEGNGDRVTLTSDKSILGLPGAVVKGGFDINGVKNIIMRNLVIQGPGACDNHCGSAGEARKDNISIVSGASNIWLDHLDVQDGEDGNTDITKKSDFVTISWTKFSYTDKSYVSGKPGFSHRFCNLLGGSDTEGSEGKLNVTFYKTWWGPGVAERQPRVRFGKVHVANCLFNSTDPGQTHNIRAAFKADILVDGNVFIGQKKPIDLFDGDYTAITVKDNNLFTNCSGNMAGKNTAFTPPYTLPIASASGIQAELTSATNGAGATITSWTSVSTSEKAISRVDLRRDQGAWTLWNSTTDELQARVLGLDGRILDRLIVPAGGSVAMAPAHGSRVVRIEGAGLSETKLVPGL